MRRGEYTYYTGREKKGTEGMAGKYDSEYSNSKYFPGGGYYEGPYSNTSEQKGYRTTRYNDTKGSYYRSGIIDSSGKPTGTLVDRVVNTLGGCIGTGWRYSCYVKSKSYFIGHASSHTGNHIGGSGGTAGSGGTVEKSHSANIYAFNGNLSSSSNEQTIIYLQGGVQNSRYKLNHFCLNDTYYEFEKNEAGSSNSNTVKYENKKASGSKTLNICVNYKNSTKSFSYNKQGIGSGAGYIEISNGSYIEK